MINIENLMYIYLRILNYNIFNLNSHLIYEDFSLFAHIAFPIYFINNKVCEIIF